MKPIDRIFEGEERSTRRQAEQAAAAAAVRFLQQYSLVGKTNGGIPVLEEDSAAGLYIEKDDEGMPSDWDSDDTTDDGEGTAAARSSESGVAPAAIPVPSDPATFTLLPRAVAAATCSSSPADVGGEIDGTIQDFKTRLNIMVAERWKPADIAKSVIYSSLPASSTGRWRARVTVGWGERRCHC